VACHPAGRWRQLELNSKDTSTFGLLLLQGLGRRWCSFSQDFLLFFLAWELELVPGGTC